MERYPRQEGNDGLFVRYSLSSGRAGRRNTGCRYQCGQTPGEGRRAPKTVAVTGASQGQALDLARTQDVGLLFQELVRGGSRSDPRHGRAPKTQRCHNQT